jgi:hypothetical protein
MLFLRRLALLFFLASLTVSKAEAPYPTDEFLNKYYEFAESFDTLSRKLLGCPLKVELKREMCKPALGGISYTDWGKTREKAKKLFQLHDLQ